MTSDTKTRLARIKGFVDDDYDLVDGDDIDWLIDQLEQALATIAKYETVLKEIAEPFPTDVPNIEFNRGMKISHDINRRAALEALESSAQGKGE